MILHRFYFNLKQSDKKSDQPGILGPGRPLIHLKTQFVQIQFSCLIESGKEIYVTTLSHVEHTQF